MDWLKFRISSAHADCMAPKGRRQKNRDGGASVHHKTKIGDTVAHLVTSIEVAARPWFNLS
jgi:hypothetical protein